MSMISELVKELRNEAQEVRLCSNECEFAELLDRAADTIEMLSEKVRADRPQGEWIDNGDRYFRCSLCGTKDTDKWHWCHGCGAQMKGADDETD